MRQFIYSMMIKEKIEVQFKFHDIEHITNNDYYAKHEWVCYAKWRNTKSIIFIRFVCPFCIILTSFLYPFVNKLKLRPFQIYLACSVLVGVGLVSAQEIVLGHSILGIGLIP